VAEFIANIYKVVSKRRYTLDMLDNYIAELIPSKLSEEEQKQCPAQPLGNLSGQSLEQPIEQDEEHETHIGHEENSSCLENITETENQIRQKTIVGKILQVDPAENAQSIYDFYHKASSEIDDFIQLYNLNEGLLRVADEVRHDGYNDLAEGLIDLKLQNQGVLGQLRPDYEDEVLTEATVILDRFRRVIKDKDVSDTKLYSDAVDCLYVSEVLGLTRTKGMMEGIVNHIQTNTYVPIRDFTRTNRLV